MITPDEYKKLIACREAINEVRKIITGLKVNEVDPKVFNESNQILKDFGFDSVHDFMDWNYKVSLETYKECIVVEGSCDGCPNDKIPNCVKLYGNCKEIIGTYGNPINADPELVKEQVKVLAFRRRFKLGGETGIKLLISQKKTNTDCPSGKGFYVDYSKTKDFPFDLFWQ